jgi:glucan phosphoethanolaminetransferase (alkaline phosphatase superfamily)
MNIWNIILTYLTSIITLKSVVIFVLLYFFVIWVIILIWITKDIKNRTNNIFLQILSILTVLIFTPFGLFLYLLIRPTKTLFEQYYSEIEHNLDSLLVDMIKNIWKKNFNIISCLECSKYIQAEFKYCPYCKKKVNSKKIKTKPLKV